MAPTDETPIPFSFFVSLCRELRKIEPNPIRNVSICSSRANTEPSSLKIFRRWVQELRRRFPRPPSQTTAILFLFLFPEEDVRRRYGMKEAGLARELLSIFGISGEKGGRGANLKRWSSPTSNLSSLGEQLYDLLSSSSVISDIPSQLSLLSVNTALDHLASKSQFSALCVRASSVTSSKTRRSILRDIYLKLDPFEAATLTQIILRDLRPILYPTKDVSSSEALLRFNSRAVYMLTLQDAMCIWDPSNTFLRCYRVRSRIEDAAHLLEGNNDLTSAIRPQIGIPVQIPKCFKAQGCCEALSKLKSSESVWAETKYDGERMQIHVSVDEHGRSEITVFSKSRRDSTLDRVATHWIIRETLGLDHENQDFCARTRTRRHHDLLSMVILEAEMVAYDEGSGIDEFWRIQDLIESSATGARRRNKRDQTSSAFDSQRHLALVFFDILYLNGKSLVSEPYSCRRAILEGIIDPIPMYAYLAHRSEVPLSGSKGFSQGLDALEHIFVSSVANHEEGLVLKASEATYADYRYPWVKLKKDYIPGLGDSVDLVLIGASWDKERGRALRVPTSTYTTFYVGATDSQFTSACSRPVVEVLFTVSYGLDRRRLEQLNFLMRSSGTTQAAVNQQDQLSFTFNLPSGLPKPQVLLLNPLLAEILGAGFTKSNEKKHYELRFPRINKIHRSNDRSWLEAVTLLEFNDIALTAIGKQSRIFIEDGVHGADQDVLEMLKGCSEDRRMVEVRQNPAYPDLGETCELPRRSSHSISRVRKRRRDDENNYPPAKLDREKCSGQLTGSKARQSDGVLPFRSLTNREPKLSFAPVTGVLTAGDNLILRPINELNECSGLHPFARFLKTAIIRLECCTRDCDATFVNQYVLPNVVHSIEAFAVGCGRKSPSTNGREWGEFRCGIIFINGESNGEWCESHPFGDMVVDIETKHKPIFVYSNHWLRSDTLCDGWLDSELDVESKCLAVYL